MGGLPESKTGKTELEVAKIPNLDRLAAKGICGFSDPVSPGITPGSAPGHLAVFGYDPFKYVIGRGVLESIGIGFELQKEDVAARGNFCTMDKNGLITDRRAGRISTDKCTELCQLLDGLVIDNIEIMVRPVKEHRFIVVFRGGNLFADVTESDPQQAGLAPKSITALTAEAEKLAAVANQFVTKAKAVLAEQHPANMVLLRGFSQYPNLPTMQQVYKLNPAAIAAYPMYRGLASLVGMEILEAGAAIEDEFAALEQNYNNYDFFFLHIKGTDSAGEDGAFDRKASILEQVDKALPGLVNLEPDVIIVTGDHSTPAVLAGHSWHPVPTLLCSRWCRPDKVSRFSESDCLFGGLGRFPSTQIMPLAMANALKLNKFGA